ncbi:16S rRNA (uracil(1498)-N(3))-methyltransferase [Calothrix sp. 336/3]|uniref:16S rRNA (uracil(1498)-N(3))-methyltransferase n=1 Tax=Calothrix sp. 336/3 TaxID=1337936 RepID=UPI0004E402C0|nr:16S rRNA (uracil(1498)-N(3))-methyltransferase [Calothrix sp. 336/3]AKG22705.1 16S rRNA methyltransferase [Calothrix sp. 336/3]
MTQLQRITIKPEQFQGEQILLTSEQLHYLLRVLRLEDGDRFIAMDGMGKWWLTQINHQQGQILELLQPETESPINITLLISLPKNGFDDVIRYCTELGVTCIAPVMSDRSLLKPSSHKQERWQKIAQEAAEQSERAIVPTILEPVKFITAIGKDVSKQKFICEARGSYPHLKNTIDTQQPLTIAIGPEGGWTDAEIKNAMEAKFQPVSLGKRILRAVTAPIVALSIVASELESD